MKIQVVNDQAQLDKIATDAGQLALLQIARQVVRIARASTKKQKGPSPRGTPPHEHYGDLDWAIAIGIDQDTGNVVIGPRASTIGERGHVLEFAGTFDPAAGRDRFGRFLTGHASRKAPSGAKWAHPFMRPALESAIAGKSVSSSFV